MGIFGSDAIYGAIKNKTNRVVKKAYDDGSKYASNILDKPNVRRAMAGLPKGGSTSSTLPTPTIAKFVDEDWRVRISVPAQGVFYNDPTNTILAPLRETNGMIFPYTPMIMMSHQASYAASQPTHSNYAQFFYGNSTVDIITITGEFTAQNQEDARYVLAVLTFLRSATKMFWGNDDSLAGTPPPVLRLNGYGDHIFNNVPVVLSNFTFELGADIDYINANIYQNSKLPPPPPNTPNSGQYADSVHPTRVPTKTAVSISLQPLYSRTQMKEFGLKEFASGKIWGDQSTGKGGFM